MFIFADPVTINWIVSLALDQLVNLFSMVLGFGKFLYSHDGNQSLGSRTLKLNIFNPGLFMNVTSPKSDTLTVSLYIPKSTSNVSGLTGSLILDFPLFNQN